MTNIFQSAARVLKMAVWAFAIFMMVFVFILWRGQSIHIANENPVMNADETITPHEGGGHLVGVYDFVGMTENGAKDGAADGAVNGGFAKLRITKVMRDGFPTQYILFSYERRKNIDPINILFEVGKRSGAKVKTLGFDIVLRPLKVIMQADVDTLLVGDLERFINENSDFPNGCVLLAYDDSFGPAYGIGYKSAKACNSEASKASIAGAMTRRSATLCTELKIRTGTHTEQIMRRPQNMNCFKKYSPPVISK